MIRICPLPELPPGEAVRIPAPEPGSDAIAVFNADGTLYAVDDTCTHQDASLADGWLEGCHIECPLHASRFDLRTGLPDCPPARRSIGTHEVVIEDGVVYVRLRVPASADAEGAA